MRVKTVLAVMTMGLAALSLATAADPPLVPVPDTAYIPEPVPVPDHPVPPSTVGEPITLYDCVKVEDRDNVPRCAKPLVISIPDPCNPCCGCRYIEICAIPDCEPRIHTSPSGRKIEYDYGEFEVEIYNRTDYVVVNYDD